MMVTPWVKCDGCDDYLCTIHEVHAHECECPALEDWVANGLDPYSEQDLDTVEQWLEEWWFPW